MSTTVSDPGNGQIDYEPIPAGLHHGICYAVYDLGTHWKEFQGRGKWTSLIRIVWELPQIRMQFEKDGKQFDLPKSTSQEFTASLHEKANLRKMLQSWRNKEFSKAELENGFDLSKLLGVNCTLQIIHNTKGDKTYANIANILPLMDKTLKKEPENIPKHFTLDSNTWNIPEGTPDWIRAKITQSKEWQEQADPSLPQEPPDPYYGSDSPPVDDYEDAIPF
jgi:hypothetical protein